ncbi:MAG: NAD(P)-dependent alcohol dehydrogenase [Dehalococcoidia bacterium]
MTNEKTMRAAVRTTYGSPDTVRIEQRERPVPGGGELLVRVRATTVNRTDCGYRAGKPLVIRLFSGFPRPKVPVLGTEFAGEVEAVGANVTTFTVGDRVCGYCEGTFGAHAEYMTVTAERLIARIPEGRTFEEAAPSTEGSHYALGILRAAKMRAGQSVMVYGASGAIGSAAVQIARSMGIKVTAVCPSQHLELLKGLGADKVVDYLTTDFTNDEQEYDLVMDAVGKSSFRACHRLLKRHGIYMSVEPGFLVQNLILALVSPLFRGRRVIFPLPRRDPEAIKYLQGLIESGEFRPVVDRVYPLDEIAEAYRYAETGQKVGNIVVAV